MTDKEPQSAAGHIPCWEDLWLPLSVRVLDRLIPAILATADLLNDLAIERSTAAEWIEPVVRKVYDELNELTRRLAQ